MRDADSREGQPPPHGTTKTLNRGYSPGDRTVFAPPLSARLLHTAPTRADPNEPPPISHPFTAKHRSNVLTSSANHTFFPPSLLLFSLSSFPLPPNGRSRRCAAPYCVRWSYEHACVISERQMEFHFTGFSLQTQKISFSKAFLYFVGQFLL